MKRFLLSISMMLVMSGVIAQDVYTVGWFINEYDHSTASLYINGVYTIGLVGVTYDYVATDVVMRDGNIYWAVNVIDSSSDCIRALVEKNGDDYLDLGYNYGGGLKINDLCVSSDNFILSAGSTNVDGVQRAALWVNDNTTPIHTYGNASYPSEALCCANLYSGFVTVGGYEWVSGTVREGKIWYGSDVLYSIPGAEVISMEIYNNSLYYLCHYPNSGAYKVFKDDDEMWTITEGGTTERAFKMFVYGGDVYVAGYGPETARIWENGNIIYDKDAYEADAVFVTSNGVYYAGHSNDDEGMVWLGDNVIYMPESCNHINGLAVEEHCYDSYAHSLPFAENFTMGNTEWTCWTKTSTTVNDFASYWHLSNDMEFGNYNAVCRYNGDSNVESWLISPQISLTDVTSATLRFNTWEQFASDYSYEGVWISTTGIFTEIWTQSDPHQAWHAIELDISAFAGNYVYIAFKYTGNNAHTWYVDDIQVTGNLGIDDVEATNIAVYPNPAKDVIHINGLEDETVNVYDAMGRLVMQQVYSGSLDVSGLAQGVYAITTGKGTMRFVKE